MVENTIKKLEYLCNTIPQLLIEIDGYAFSVKETPEKWSKKEIIGHLIDSATNNHHRFVRGQFEDAPAISYDQNKWNEFGHYQQIDGQQLITFWEAYNKQLLVLIKNIPTTSLQRECKSGDGKCLTLEFLIDDYVVHLEHHLHQILDY